MSCRLLFGPVTSEFAELNQRRPPPGADCLTFGWSAGKADLVLDPEDTWVSLCSRLPASWQPDGIVLYLAYTTLPPALWSAPVPLIGWAADWPLLWHAYRQLLPCCDLVLSDSAGVETMARAGIRHAKAVNLFGCQPAFLEATAADQERDIDILFVGNLNAAVQRERLSWLARLARLGSRWRVVLRTNVFKADYRKLLCRSRIVFNRGHHGECNLRAFEAAAAGALLVQEADNRETFAYFRPGQECATYTADDLEDVLERYLTDEPLRRTVAEAGRARARQHTFPAAWEEMLQGLEGEWPALQEKARQRSAAALPAPLLGRCWQVAANPRAHDTGLVADLHAALAARPKASCLQSTLGLVVARMAPKKSPPGIQHALECFRLALTQDPGDVLARLNLVEALVVAGDRAAAVEEAGKALTTLQTADEEAPRDWLGGLHYPPGFALFQVEWERAAWEHVGQPLAEARAKVTLLRWRLHTILANLTGKLDHHYEAALARPDLPVTQAALGCALARDERAADALPHLQAAVTEDPFDLPAARALGSVLEVVGNGSGRRRLAYARRLLHQATPQVVPAEPWFAAAPPAGDELASLIILCCNQLKFTRQCLDTVLRHTRPPYELILVDNGSTDGTGAYLEDLQQRAVPQRVVVVRNETNRGYAAGCNQGLAQARGDYLVTLNNDTLVTPRWLEGLIGLALHDWPRVGLVGPMSNGRHGPAETPGNYRDEGGLDAFAAHRRQEFAGQAMDVERLVGFCWLLRRDVLQRVGPLDEQFGVGFFEDDDFGLRVRGAGFRLALALGVFIHHYGNATFLGLGIDRFKQLQDNFELFEGKWGEKHCAGYRLPDPEPEREGADPGPEGAAAQEPSVIPVDATAKRPSVSFCMIVRNEEANLPACIGSVRDLVDEIVVVDTGSTDRTKEVAAGLGAKVVDFAWCDDFAAARNESLRHATGDWIFWLDADEHLDEQNRGRLRGLFAKLPATDNVAFVMRQRSPLEAGPHATAQVDQVRLFRNHPDIRWQYRLHEQILLAVRKQGGAVAHTGIVITHAGYSDPAVQGSKIERNQRLLELEAREHPDDAFVLFNLGNMAITRGQVGEALAYYRRSLELSPPGDNLVPKLHALVTRSHHRAGQRAEALAACRAGREVFPHDEELTFWEGVLLRDAQDLAGAEACFLRVLQAPEREQFTSTDAGLRGYGTRNLLAEIYRDQGRVAAAEAQWRAAVAECPGFTAAWLGLAGLLLAQQRWLELEQVLQHVQADPQAALDGKVLQGRAHLARQEFAPARQLLEEASAHAPQALQPRLYLSHVLLQEGKDPQAAEQALRSLLALAPDHGQAQHNLRLLLREQKQAPDSPAAEVAPSVIIQAPGAGTRARVSLCMIVKNEEHNLPGCLGSVADLVDEIIVVDTGSTDGTRAIASRFGARVFDFPWVDSFAAARNESLRHATGDWVLWLDADDRLDEDNRARLRVLLGALPDGPAAFVFKCLCLPDSTGRSTMVDHVRLFRRLPELRWRYRIHEQILPALREARAAVNWSDVIVHHTGYQDPALRGLKLQRDLRLLHLELQEQPDNPFTLFNLGSIALEQGQAAEALPLLERSLKWSGPNDSIVRKLYVLLTQALRKLDRPKDALGVCLKGLRACPDDAELLFQEGVSRRGLGDAAGAEAAWKAVLRNPPEQHFVSVHAGLRGHLTRHNLALLYREQGRLAEAEDQWRAALAAQPDYVPAWEGLADLQLTRQDWAGLEALAVDLCAVGKTALATTVRARGHLTRREFDEARRLLHMAIAKEPKAVRLWLLLAYTWLQEDKDPEAAERALRDVLKLDPGHTETRQNLMRLLRRQGKPVDEGDASV